MVVHAVAVSLFLEALLAPATVALLYPYRGQLDRHPFRVVGWTFVVTVVMPLVGGCALGRVTDALTRDAAVNRLAKLRRLRMDLRPRPPSAFDWLVGTKYLPDPSIIVVVFRDGRRAAGLYAAGSWVPTSPQTQGLYLAPEMLLDSQGEPTGDVVPRSQGLLIPDLSDVQTVRILEA
jgi:hypothetical protein